MVSGLQRRSLTLQRDGAISRFSPACSAGPPTSPYADCAGDCTRTGRRRRVRSTNPLTLVSRAEVVDGPPVKLPAATPLLSGRLWGIVTGQDLVNCLMVGAPGGLPAVAVSRSTFALRATADSLHGYGSEGWAHFEFTRINIKPTILPKKFWERRVVRAFASIGKRPQPVPARRIDGVFTAARADAPH